MKNAFSCTMQHFSCIIVGQMRHEKMEGGWGQGDSRHGTPCSRACQDCETLAEQWLSVPVKQGYQVHIHMLVNEQCKRLNAKS